MKIFFAIVLCFASVCIIQINTAPIPITISSIHENPLPSSPPNLKPYPNISPKFNYIPRPLPLVGQIPYPRPIAAYPQPIIYQRYTPPTYISTNQINVQPIGLQLLDNESLNSLGEFDQTNICEIKGKYNHLCLLRGSMEDEEEAQYYSHFKCLKQAKCSFNEGKCQWTKTTKYRHCLNFFKTINNQSTE